ncbi:LTD domain-containing protein [Haematococcus lacustris]|uniref:LTD domain-containing protein n=1 Tax=Haematococcus lacustris TaxID=44745 RepID=A0A699Z3W8_HAELA|nr:LTD domain-containing protein [Haematococcus lacustris]
MADPDLPQLCQGKTPARVIIDRVVAFPSDGQTVKVVLRNVGGQTANITGFRLTDSDTRNVEAAQNLVFGRDVCNTYGNTTIEPGRAMELVPRTNSTPCGFPFGISFR